MPLTRNLQLNDAKEMDAGSGAPALRLAKLEAYLSSLEMEIAHMESRRASLERENAASLALLEGSDLEEDAVRYLGILLLCCSFVNTLQVLY